MSKENDKNSQVTLSTEADLGPSLTVSREEFEKIRAKVIKEEFGDEQKPKNNDGEAQSNDKPDDKPDDKPQQ